MEDAFRAAHTLKGVCLNLGFSDLYHTSYDITESFVPERLKVQKN